MKYRFSKYTFLLIIILNCISIKVSFGEVLIINKPSLEINAKQLDIFLDSNSKYSISDILTPEISKQFKKECGGNMDEDDEHTQFVVEHRSDLSLQRIE